jgi:hypothetical protein
MHVRSPPRNLAGVVLPAVPWLRRDRRGRPGLVGQVALVTIFLMAYDSVANLARGRVGHAFTNAGRVLRIEATLHLDPEHALNAWVARHHAIALAASTFYDSAHYVVTMSVLVLIYARRPAAYRRLRDVFVVANTVGLLGFWLFPLAPPRMLPGYVDTVAVTGALGGWAHTVASNANEFAAMPSLHLAWALWCAVAVFDLTRRRRARRLVVAHVVATVLVILGTANHYVLDAAAGAGCLLVSVLVVRAVARLRARGRPIRTRRALTRSEPHGPSQPQPEPALQVGAVRDTDRCGLPVP